jgi:hypothetical protein
VDHGTVRLACAALIALILTRLAASPNATYLPLKKHDLRTRVKMTRRQYFCRGGEPFSIGPATFRVTRDSLYAAGIDRGGKAWTFASNPDNCVFWHADLDGDGVQDFVFLNYQGLGLRHMLVIMFDAEQRPIPWVMVGSFLFDQNGVPEFLDINRDGRAELAYASSTPVYGSSTITELYEARAGQWQRIRGRVGSETFPIVTKYARKVRPTKVPDTPDYSNNFSGPASFTRVQWKSGRCAGVLSLPESSIADECHDWLILDGNRACLAPSIVIFDNENGRLIGNAHLLLDAVAGKTVVRLAGRRSSPEACAPFYMWVSPR